MRKLINIVKNLLFLWGLEKSLSVEYITADLENRQRFKVNEFFHLSQLEFRKHLHNLKKNQQIVEISITYRVNYFKKDLKPL